MTIINIRRCCQALFNQSVLIRSRPSHRPEMVSNFDIIIRLVCQLYIIYINYSASSTCVCVTRLVPFNESIAH